MYEKANIELGKVTIHGKHFLGSHSAKIKPKFEQKDLPFNGLRDLQTVSLWRFLLKTKFVSRNVVAGTAMGMRKHSNCLLVCKIVMSLKDQWDWDCGRETECNELNRYYNLKWVEALDFEQRDLNFNGKETSSTISLLCATKKRYAEAVGV